MLRRVDFRSGDREWQEHPDDTLPRMMTLYLPERFWIYQVLPRSLLMAVTRDWHGGPCTASTVAVKRGVNRPLFLTQDTTIKMTSFVPTLESSFAAARIPRRSGPPRQ